MAELFVLHPPAHVVHAPVGDAHDVERVSDTGDVVEAVSYTHLTLPTIYSV